MKKSIALFILTLAVSVHARQISDNLAVRAIIGESASEPFQTKLAIAGALRNRGTLDGVRGRLNARMIDVQSKKTWADARRAWRQSATNNIVNGATHFESTNFPVPCWATSLTPAARIGRFNFYKP